jgi:hypothetical protein
MLAWGNNWIQGIAIIENKTSTGSAKRMLVCSGLPTVGRRPTLSAVRMNYEHFHLERLLVKECRSAQEKCKRLPRYLGDFEIGAPMH